MTLNSYNLSWFHKNQMIIYKCEALGNLTVEVALCELVVANLCANQNQSEKTPKTPVGLGNSGYF